MSTAAPSIRDLARTLVAASERASGPHPQARVLVNENLRLSLTRFAGTEGFASLVRRSLRLASATIPTLQGAELRADGQVEAQLFAHDDVLWREAATAVTAQLLVLLVTFIGEPLTRRLVREACPETAPDE